MSYSGTHELERVPYAGRARGTRAVPVRRVRKKGLGGSHVPNAELRDAAKRAIAEGRLTWSDLAREVGGSADGTRVKRMLGVAAQSDGSCQTSIRDETAAVLCRALDIYPRDIGL